MSVWGLFLKYSENFANFSLDILIKYILIEKKSVNQKRENNVTPMNSTSAS